MFSDVKLARMTRHNGVLVPAPARSDVVSLQAQMLTKPNHISYPPVKTRSVIFEASVTLDGFIEGPNGEMDWLSRETPESLEGGALFAEFDTMFFGRKAYEKIALPPLPISQMTEEQRQFFYMMYAMRKYVFSRHSRHVEGNGMVISNNVDDEVRRICREDGKNILFCGGADIFDTFARLDLIDEYVFVVHPVVLRKGKRLVRDNRSLPALSLIEKQVLTSGVMIMRYRPTNRIKATGI